MYGPAWKLLGLAANPPFPANCEEAGQCPICGSRFVFHERAFKDEEGQMFCDQFCAERWSKFDAGERQYLLRSMARDNAKKDV